MDDSPNKDSALGGVAIRLARNEPESAMNWASQINDPKTRVKRLLHASRFAFRNNDDGLIAWLSSSQLSQKEKGIILKAHTKRRKK